MKVPSSRETAGTVLIMLDKRQRKFLALPNVIFQKCSHEVRSRIVNLSKAGTSLCRRDLVSPNHIDVVRDTVFKQILGIV